MDYRHIDHTADFGLVVTAPSLSALFADAAAAMMQQIVDLESLAGGETLTLSVNGLDRADLMVNWLREILFLWNGKARLVHSAEIRQVGSRRLTATVRWEAYRPERHTIKQEIKAVTYHGIRVEPAPAGWEAQIIFDI